MSDCLFCKIIAGEIPSTQRHSSDLVIVPREHIGSAADLRDTAAHGALLARMHHVAQEIAVEAGYGDRGWRLVSNVGLEGGQAIEHLHYHLLAGRQLAWPPG
jgi:histidine triad (HIT) family protein